MNSQPVYIIKAFFLLLLIFFSVSLLNLFGPVSDSNNRTVPGEATATEIKYNDIASKGKALFLSKCASCHNIFKDMTGPALIGFEERGPWSDRQHIYSWVKNPAAFMAKNDYTRNLKEKFGSMMTAFPDITNEEIDQIIEYIRNQTTQQVQYSLPIASR